jgi:hypothetical protein
MEIILVVSLVSIAVAAQPFAVRRISPLVQGTLGSLCVGISLILTALVASGLVSLGSLASLEKSAQAAALPSVGLPEAPGDVSPPPSPTKPADMPADESGYFETPAIPSENAPSDDIRIESDDTVVIPPGRPSWVEAPPQREGSIHSTSVCSDPWTSHQKASQELDKKLVTATSEYIAEHLGSNLAASLIHYDLPEIKRKLLPSANVYHEKILVSFGPMHQVHAKLEFSPDFRDELDRRWAEIRATYRLGQTGLVGGGVLLLLATVFGYFRLDNATRGYYTGRLQFMAAAAILAIIASGVMFSRWIYWL